MDEPLASCVMVRFDAYVSKRKLVCKFDIVRRTFLLMFIFYHCLYTLPKYVTFIIPLIWFHPEIAFFMLSTKCYHFSIRVVSTLSYLVAKRNVTKMLKTRVLGRIIYHISLLSFLGLYAYFRIRKSIVLYTMLMGCLEISTLPNWTIPWASYAWVWMAQMNKNASMPEFKKSNVEIS